MENVEVKTRTPVAFIIFRRADNTRRVFERIAQARPPKLFIFADGPSLARPGEAEKCAAARAVVERIDWDCEVVRDYSPTNMGPWKRIASGITAAFEQVEELIVLEDDCLPDVTFFRFCDELLERYRRDERVMHIAGNHLHPANPRNIPYSYSFAWHNVAWGYATWRRAWQHFDLAVPLWAQLRETDFLDQIVKNPVAVENYRKIFDSLYQNPGEFDGYDWAWSFACWSQAGLSILPRQTLVQNIGFDPDSTHFADFPNDPRGAIVAGPMQFPMRHPPYVLRDRAADDYIIDTYQAHQEPLSKYRQFRRSVGARLPVGVRRAGSPWLSIMEDVARLARRRMSALKLRATELRRERGRAQTE
jgi:hypothetical protein